MRSTDRLGLVVATVIAAIAAWIVSDVLPWPARLATVFLLVLMPALGLVQISSLRKAAARNVSKLGIYASSAVNIWFIGGVAVLASVTSGYTPRLLGLFVPGTGHLVLWTLIAAASGVLLLIGVRLLGGRESALVDLILPRTGVERTAFVGLSLSAGVGEELAYRSFLIPALTVASGHIWIGAAISAAAFGMVHSYQGALGVARAAALGFVLAVPFVVTGSVLPSMIAHAGVDLISGLWLAGWLMRR